ncbi:15450_t:CDS:2 [Funneliformis geosporum]|nr:15450_t:CDS:2 [Funneliformis geosporum]
MIQQDNKGKFLKKLKLTDEFDEWEDEDDSGWNEEKYRPYLVGKIKKSTYFYKYGPSGSFTKDAKGTANILTFINKNQSTPIDFEEILDDMEDEEQNLLNLNKKINILKIELKEQQKLLTVAEYNKK